MGGVEVPQAPRGWGVGERVSPPHWGKGLGRGLCSLPRKLFVLFVENTIFWCILTRLFLKSYANGSGSNLLNPSSVRHCLELPLSKTPNIVEVHNIGTDSMGAIATTAKRLWTSNADAPKSPHRIFCYVSFLTSKMSQFLHIGVWFNHFCNQA